MHGTLGGGKAVLSPGWYCDLLGEGRGGATAAHFLGLNSHASVVIIHSFSPIAIHTTWKKEKLSKELSLFWLGGVQWRKHAPLLLIWLPVVNFHATSSNQPLRSDQQKIRLSPEQKCYWTYHYSALFQNIEFDIDIVMVMALAMSTRMETRWQQGVVEGGALQCQGLTGLTIHNPRSVDVIVAQTRLENNPPLSNSCIVCIRVRCWCSPRHFWIKSLQDFNLIS